VGCAGLEVRSGVGQEEKIGESANMEGREGGSQSRVRQGCMTGEEERDSRGER
jgi:hypothetical protein